MIESWKSKSFIVCLEVISELPRHFPSAPNKKEKKEKRIMMNFRFLTATKPLFCSSYLHVQITISCWLKDIFRWWNYWCFGRLILNIFRWWIESLCCFLSCFEMKVYSGSINKLTAWQPSFVDIVHYFIFDTIYIVKDSSAALKINE